MFNLHVDLNMRVLLLFVFSAFLFLCSTLSFSHHKPFSVYLNNVKIVKSAEKFKVCNTCKVQRSLRFSLHIFNTIFCAQSNGYCPNNTINM